MLIYKITNNINGKIYVGQTKHTLKTRFGAHKRSSRRKEVKSLISKAIKKYGEENFSIEQIDTAKNLTCLNKKEIFWIKSLNSQKPEGYNILKGGKTNEKQIKYDFICYEFDFLKRKTKITSYEEFLKITKKSWFDKKKLIKGIEINNRYYKRTDTLTEKELKELTKIIHYSEFGEILGIYKNTLDMEKKTKEKEKTYWNTAISMCLRKKEKLFDDKSFVVKTNENLKEIRDYKIELAKKKTYQEKKVRQFDLDFNYIKTFKTLKEAAETIGLKNGANIIAVCKGLRRTAGGFIWIYEDDV